MPECPVVVDVWNVKALLLQEITQQIVHQPAHERDHPDGIALIVQSFNLLPALSRHHSSRKQDIEELSREGNEPHGPHSLMDHAVTIVSGAPKGDA